MERSKGLFLCSVRYRLIFRLLLGRQRGLSEATHSPASPKLLGGQRSPQKYDFLSQCNLIDLSGRIGSRLLLTLTLSSSNPRVGWELRVILLTELWSDKFRQRPFF